MIVTVDAKDVLAIVFIAAALGAWAGVAIIGAVFNVICRWVERRKAKKSEKTEERN